MVMCIYGRYFRGRKAKPSDWLVNDGSSLNLYSQRLRKLRLYIAVIQMWLVNTKEHTLLYNWIYFLDDTGGDRLLKKKIPLWRKCNSLCPPKKEGVEEVMSHYMKVLRTFRYSHQFICIYYFYYRWMITISQTCENSQLY